MLRARLEHAEHEVGGARLLGSDAARVVQHRNVGRAGFVIFSENTPFSFLFSFSVGKFSGRKFSGSPSSTALIVVLLVQPAPEEEDLTKEGEGEQRWLLHVLYTVLSLRK